MFNVGKGIVDGAFNEMRSRIKKVDLNDNNKPDIEEALALLDKAGPIASDLAADIDFNLVAAAIIDNLMKLPTKDESKRVKTIENIRKLGALIEEVDDLVGPALQSASKFKI